MWSPPPKKKKVVAEIQGLFQAEIKNLKGFSGQKLVMSKKKGFRRRLKCFFFCITIPAVFGAIFDWTLFAFFLSSSSAQISMGDA